MSEAGNGSGVWRSIALFLMGMTVTAAVAWATHVRTAVTREEMDNRFKEINGTLALQNENLRSQLLKLQLDMAKVVTYLRLSERADDGGEPQFKKRK